MRLSNITDTVRIVNNGIYNKHYHHFNSNILLGVLNESTKNADIRINHRGIHWFYRRILARTFELRSNVKRFD